MLAIFLVVCLAWPALAVSARIPAPQRSRHRSILRRRQLCSGNPHLASTHGRGVGRQRLLNTGYAAASGVTLAQAVFQQAHAGDFDDERARSEAMAGLDADRRRGHRPGPGRHSFGDNGETTPQRRPRHFFETEAGALSDAALGASVALAAFDADGDGDSDVAAAIGGWHERACCCNDGFRRFTLAEAGDFDDEMR